jgi:hypothetical protein
LALYSVDVRASADDRVLGTRAVLQHKRGADDIGDPNEIDFAPDVRSQLAWFRDFRPGDTIQPHVEYMLKKDNALIALDPPPFDTHVYLLPPPFPGSMTVQLMASPDWDGIDHVVVSIQKSADQPTGTFTFSKPDDAYSVSLDLPDPLDRSFRVRMATWFTDGTQREDDDWKSVDRPLVTAPWLLPKLVVDVTAVGPELPQAGVLAIEVELRYIDAKNLVRKIDTAIIRALADKYHWEVDLKDPSLRSYDYQVTIDRGGNGREVKDWVTTTERNLIIPVVKA